MTSETQIKFYKGLECLKETAIKEAVNAFGMEKLTNKEIVFHNNQKSPREGKINVWNLEKRDNKKALQIQYITPDLEVYFNINQKELTIKKNEQKK